MAGQKYLDLEGLKLVLSKLKEHGYQGYGLSQEDFTTELREKYDAITAASVEALTPEEIEAALNGDGPAE